MRPVDAEHLKRAAAERPRDAAAALADAVELRAALLSLFTDLALRREPEAKDLASLNEAMLAWQVVPAADGFARGWGGDADTLDRMLPPLAHSATIATAGAYGAIRAADARAV